MKNDDFEKKDAANEELSYENEETDSGVRDNGGEEDLSMYYPDGDGEHMEEDDGTADPFHKKKEKKKDTARKKNTKLTGSQIALIAVVFILYTVVIVTASWILFYKPAQQKKNEDMPFDTTPLSGAEVNPAPPVREGDAADPAGQNPEGASGSTDGKPEDGAADPSGDKSGTDASSSKTESAWKVRDGLYNILVVGMDKQANLADVTMLVNVNTADNSITVMQIPRDTLITTGVATDKINAQYATLVKSYYLAGDDDCYMSALSQYARLLEQSLCIKIHKTVLVDLEGFPAIVNTVGPIRVFVPGPMYYEDPYQDLYIAIGEGWQELDGEAAEGFVRFRSDYVQADLGRMNAQKIFLTALYQKVVSLLKKMDVGKITELAQVVSYNVTTDMSVSDLVFFAKSFLSIGTENVTMLTIPGDMADEYYGSHYVINRAATLNIINDHFNIYENKIEDNIFDRNWTFCYNYDVYTSVYYAPAAYAYTSEYTADEIAEDGIDIPFVH